MEGVVGLACRAAARRRHGSARIHGALRHRRMSPEQRYSEAGGVDMARENASFFADARGRVLDAAPRIDAKYV